MLVTEASRQAIYHKKENLLLSAKYSTDDSRLSTMIVNL